MTTAATYFNTVENSFGFLLPQAQIDVYAVGTNSHTPLTDAFGNASPLNPVATDANGFFQFFTASPEAVDIVINRGGYAQSRVTVSTIVPPPPGPSGGITGPITDTGGQFFNVFGYGAKGDGTTDDTAAITATIAAAAAAGAGGGIVFFPPATYLRNSNVTVTNGVTLMVSPGVHFSGPGQFLVSGEGSILDLRSNLTGYGQNVPYQAVESFSRSNSGATGSMPQKVFNADSIDFFDLVANVDPRLNALQMGAVVGNYVCLIPYGPQGVTPQSVMAVFDRTRPFKDPKSWQAIDLKVVTGQATAEGFLGVCVLNGVMYLSPKQTKNQAGFIGTVKGNAHFFKWDSSKGRPDEPMAWSHFDGTTKAAIIDGRRGWAGCAHDGRYVYYAPANDISGTVHGLAVRVDTLGSWTDPNSWQTINLPSIFDATVGGYQSVTFCQGPVASHMYYVQTQGASTSDDVARFNVNGAFISNGDGAWEHVHVATLGFPNAANYGFPVGAAFVGGRYLLTVPFGNNGGAVWNGQVALFDTADPAATTLATSSNAWAIFDLTTVNARCKGYQYGWEAGDFVYLIPTNAGDGAPPPFIRWNKTRPFALASSWEVVTPSTAPPWQTGGAHDGTYFYCAPLREFPLGSNVYSGRVYRVFSPDHPAGYATQYLGKGIRFFVDVNGQIGINTNDPQYGLDVNATMHAAGLIQTDATLRAALGSGTGVGKAPLDGDVAFPNVGNLAATQTTLKSFPVPANTLSHDGMYIEFWGEGTSANNADADKNVTVSYGPSGSTTAVVSTTFTNNAASATFRVRGTIMRSGVGTQEGGGDMLNQAGTSGGYKRITTPTKDETVDWILVFTGNGTTANDVILKSCAWALHRGQT